MVDYSRAATSKAAKESFDSNVDSLIKALNGLKEEHDTEWEIEEGYRKGRSAIIENVIPILKKYDVKLEKPLSRCNHEELMEELRQATEVLPYEPREEVEVAMVRIDGRYTQIQEQGKKLESLNDRLAKFHLPEKDYDQEVVISFEDLKKAHEAKKQREEIKEKEEIKVEKQEEQKVVETRASRIPSDPDLEEVVEITKADEELLDSFNEMVQTELVVQTPSIIEEKDIVSFDESEVDVVEEEFSFDDAFDSLFDEGKGEDEDDASLMEEFLESKEDIMPEEPDYQTYELKEDQTLSEIVDYVYEGKLSWYDIYRYGNNQGMINRKCAELKLDPEDAAYTPGALSGISIEYPKNFVTYQGYKKEEEEKGFAKAA